MCKVTLALLLALSSVTSGCSFFSTATQWNGRVGPDGRPVQVKTATKVGLQALIVLPLLGDMAINGLVHDMTAAIKTENGDKVRVIQAGSENYWYGFPPFTWIVTPVISTVAAEYEVVGK
jgi:hypothetical protein